MISAIVALDNNYGIGYKNKLLCPIKEDLKQFKKLTTGSIIVMGRKTWDSLPKKPLQNRVNIIVTRNVKNIKIEKYDDGSCVVFATLKFIKENIKEFGKTNNIYIIGGGQIYKELLPYCEYIYATRIYNDFNDVDTYFPELKQDEWYVLEADELKKENDIEYQFCIYKRIKGDDLIE